MTVGANYRVTYRGSKDNHCLFFSSAGDGRERAIRFAKERGVTAVVWYLPGPGREAERIWPDDGRGVDASN